VPVVIGSADPDLGAQLATIVDAGRGALSCEVAVHRAQTTDQLLARAGSFRDAIFLLDWALAGDDTPALIADALAAEPGRRVIVIPPWDRESCQRLAWAAGACCAIPRAQLTPRWLASVLTLVAEPVEWRPDFRTEAR